MIPKPHGGRLVHREIDDAHLEKFTEEIRETPKLHVDHEQAQELENIALGLFSPLEGFMEQYDFLRVIEHMRLESDIPWTMPIVLHADTKVLQDKGIETGSVVAIVDDSTKRVMGLIEIAEIYKYSKEMFAEQVYKTKDTAHPGVAKIMGMGECLIGGKVTLITEQEGAFDKYKLKPTETRTLFKEKGWRDVVAFQTRNPPHLGHEYVQKAALTFVDGLFINPVIGKKKAGDFRDDVILAAYEELMKGYYLKERAVMSILSFEMRYGGPREAIFHAIVRKNFGCSHIIIGRDHAGVGSYYKPYEAQEIFSEFPDLGIVPMFFRAFYYCKKCEAVVNDKICPHKDSDIINFSGTKIRKALLEHKELPREMMRPEVVKVIQQFDNPLNQ